MGYGYGVASDPSRRYLLGASLRGTDWQKQTIFPFRFVEKLHIDLSYYDEGQSGSEISPCEPPVLRVPSTGSSRTLQRQYSWCFLVFLASLRQLSSGLRNTCVSALG